MPDYCVFFNIKIVRAYREGNVILLFVLLFGLHMNSALCGPRPGQKCRSDSLCVLASIQETVAVSQDLQPREQKLGSSALSFLQTLCS